MAACIPSRLATAATLGLCVRGTTRSFCIGCPFLVRRPEYLDRVEFFLESYTQAAEAHERMGDLAGARERAAVDRRTQAVALGNAPAGGSRKARQLDTALEAAARWRGELMSECAPYEDGGP